MATARARARNSAMNPPATPLAIDGADARRGYGRRLMAGL
ncbi:Hypothetical protein I596_198 [Dokdonella koreensis DS-123]|uniref:Uncharacterized protein n=1 Tax=Dokdonella koreensis DS-123 TaxID=1300342 RepID=A0A167G7T2_9GAMM|nr:Hypothetical protein I596_198 [Dokdonella koreensis DS-123]